MTVSIERSDRVVICSLADPDGRNALTAATATQLADAIAGLEDTDAHCVLLRGEGDTFCASGDVGAHVGRVRGNLDASAWRERLEAVGDAVAAVYDCPLPTVAAVDGPTFGAGAALALACDLRIASTEGSIGFGFRRFGLAATAGVTYLLPQVVDRDTALQLLYTGELVAAGRAAELGLFTDVYAVDTFEDELVSLLATLSTGPREALIAAKDLLRAKHADLQQTLDRELETASRLADTDDFEEGVSAFVAEREPQF
ncbi:enoyl-CoA hydratase/isomerase family protein [Halapricum hydrolyticum]|uniref:Enoyl-CoA hydratase-related protein n=1 Tax=Halapricum hydrolyticum TaxID=2979991 RepID=A0AAE3LEY7_9EURY|nr:enoyl-CoA hydratase-related protein [Halapricum hydrolyticum]MCU4717813.1 enoyl-CoA hydratase-related protein [Halapricum hydrolyticum]MCU4726977.1 enoyl-CoA hydratase-related protein [Halapricum hydrolyticum]